MKIQCYKMEVSTVQSGRRIELEAKIKSLEEEKTKLQSEIVNIKEMLATASLEKKAKDLETEVTQLKAVKSNLENQNQGKPASDNSKQPTTIQTVQQVKQSGTIQPVRYGTYSKLSLS